MTRIYSEKPLAEITLRRYEKPENLDERQLVKKICLSLGLLQPGDSRDSIVDILLVILKAERPLTSQEIEERVKKLREEKGLSNKGLASSNIRRQLLRLRQLFLIEKIKNQYRVTENLRLEEIFNEKIERYYIQSIIERIKEYLRQADTTILEAKNKKEDTENQ